MARKAAIASVCRRRVISIETGAGIVSRDWPSSYFVE